MPDRKMRDAGRNRREDPATLIVSRTQYCRGHRFCLCRRRSKLRCECYPHFPVRQKDPFIISCLFFSSGNSLFYPYGYVFGGISCRDSPSMKESPMRQRPPLSRCGECVCPWCSGCSRRFPEACVRGRSSRAHSRSPR